MKKNFKHLCGAHNKTKDGLCSNPVKKEGLKCHQHGGEKKAKKAEKDSSIESAQNQIGKQVLQNILAKEKKKE